MAREKKPVHKVVMTKEKCNIMTIQNGVILSWNKVT